MNMYKEYLEELHEGKSLLFDETGFIVYWIRATVLNYYVTMKTLFGLKRIYRRFLCLRRLKK